jgi:predicted dinucleotide-binding enzyme
VRARHTALQDFIAGDHPEARKPAESLVRVAGIEPVNAEPSFKVT